MIKLGKNVRATLSTDFIEALREISKAFVEDVKKQVDFNPRSKAYILDRNKMQLAHHINLLKDKDAFDLEITHLRGMKFREFKVIDLPAKVWTISPHYSINYKATRYISGVTQPIVCNYEKRKMDLGEYRISIPLFRLGVGPEGSRDMHFIPMRAEMAYKRFYHHYASPCDEMADAAPEQLPSSTCWGSFESVPHIVADRKVFEIFKILEAYLSRANPNSLLVHGGLPHAKEL